MSDTNQKTDQEKGDEVLRRMLKMPPDKSRASEKVDKQKQDGNPGKKRRPAEDKG